MTADRPTPTRRALLTGALAGGALALAPALARAQTARIALESLIKGNTQDGSISVNGVTESRGRVFLTVTLSLPTYFFNLDRYGGTRGNFGTGDLQLFWRGKTLGTSGDARGIGASTIVYAEQWGTQDLLFDKVRKLVSSRSWRADLRFETRWDRATGRASLGLAELRMPGADPVALRAVRSLVNWYTSDTALMIRNVGRLMQFSPEIEETLYTVSGRGSGFDCRIRLSLDAARLRRQAAERGLGGLQDQRLWHTLIAEILGA